MKAKFVHESINFERGLDPKEVMGVGMKQRLKEAMEAEGVQYYDDEIALGWAARQGRSDLVEYLLKKGIDPNTIKTNSISYALSSGDLDTIKLLVEAGAELNNQSGFQFGKDIIKSSETTEILEYLISKGLNVQKYENELINWSMQKEESDWIEMLVDAGIDMSNANLFNYDLRREPVRWLLDYLSDLATEKYPKSS